MFTLTAERPDGERLTLTQFRSAYTVTYAGFGPVAATVATSSMGVADGDKINSARRGSRNPVLSIAINGNVEQNRIRLYAFFSPGHNVRLYYKNGARNVYTEGVVESFVCDQFATPVRAQVSIICPLPYWIGAEEIVKNLSGVVSMFQFPFAIPAVGVELSSLKGEDYALACNDGDEPTGFITTIYARDTVTNPLIYNVVTNEAFRINGQLTKGQTLTINTSTSKKRVTITEPGGIVTNALHRKQRDSIWLQLAPGDNYIAYAAEKGKEAMVVTLIYNHLYVGV